MKVNEVLSALYYLNEDVHLAIEDNVKEFNGSSAKLLEVSQSIDKLMDKLKPDLCELIRQEFPGRVDESRRPLDDMFIHALLENYDLWVYPDRQ